VNGTAQHETGEPGREIPRVWSPLVQFSGERGVEAMRGADQSERNEEVGDAIRCATAEGKMP
jgi:hypothetical protein